MTEPDALYHELGIPDLGTSELQSIRYEVRDESGNRRLRDLLEQYSHSNGSETLKDADPIFLVTTEDAEHTQRYRFRESGSVEKYHIFKFPLQGVRTSVSSREQAGWLDVMIQSERELGLPNHKGKVEVGPSRFLTKNGGIDYEPTLEFRVAGLKEEREQVRDFLESTNRRWGISPERGMLLAGPPGTGKTEVVMEVCRELYGAVPITISGPEILSRWVGESERLLRDKFERARDSDAGVLYIDEIDAIARSRSQATQDYSAQIVAQLLVLLDGLESKQTGQSLKVIASTNMAELVDPALRRPGRLGRSQRFGPLTGDNALSVLHHYLERIYFHAKFDGDVNTSLKQDLSEEIRAFVENGTVDSLNNREGQSIQSYLRDRTGAEIEQLVQEATRQADTQKTSLSPRHLRQQHESVTVDDDTVQFIEASGSTNAIDGPSPFRQAQILCITPSEAVETGARSRAIAAFEQLLENSDADKGQFREIHLTEELVQSEVGHIERYLWSNLTADKNHPVCVFVNNAERIAQAIEYSEAAKVVVKVLSDRLITTSEESEEIKPVYLAVHGDVKAMPFPPALINEI